MRDDITCGSHNCFQISGGRDMVIDGNRINGTTTAGVLTAGATRVAITRNRMKGMPGKSPVATQIASPGMEWDNYAGVENMTSTAIVIANNIIDGWGTAVQLDAARDVAVVHNTVADGTGVRFNHRTPHDQMGNVILNGNSDIRIWNDILPSITLATGEMKPAFESNNVIWKGGGGGPGDVTSMPMFAGSGEGTTCSRRAAPASTARSSTPRHPSSISKTGPGAPCPTSAPASSPPRRGRARDSAAGHASGGASSVTTRISSLKRSQASDEAARQLVRTRRVGQRPVNTALIC